MINRDTWKVTVTVSGIGLENPKKTKRNHNEIVGPTGIREEGTGGNTVVKWELFVVQ
jgi:hypothetical protein